MVHDAGYIAYGTDFRLIDLTGLKTPEALELNKQIISPTRGARRMEAVSALAQETKAEYLIVLRTWPIMVAIPDGLRALGRKVEPVRLDGAYQVYRITAPVG